MASSYDPNIRHWANTNTPTNSPAPAPRGSSGPVKTSGLAIASLVTALISPIFLCLCGLSAIPSLVAVITGHLSLARIKRSAGQLSGREIAIAGTVFGYVMFTVSLGILALILPGFVRGWNNADRPPAGRQTAATEASERLREAELEVTSASGGNTATGNSPAAKKLAEEYAESLKRLRDLAFTADKDRVFSLTDGNFVTHCELHDYRCAFIVHVPSYRHFEKDAKESLADGAWLVAQIVASTEMQPGDQLAVGLRGAVMYGDIMIGEVDPENAKGEEPRDGRRDDLVPFFALPAAESSAADSPAAAMPTEPKPLDVAPRPAPTVELPPLFPDDPGEDRVAPDSTGLPPEDLLSSSPRTPSEPRLSNEPMLPSRTRPKAAPPAQQSTASDTEETQRDNSRQGPVPEEAVSMSPDVVQQFPEMGWGVESLAFSPDGRWLAAGKSDQALLILDIESGATLSVAEQLNDLGQVTRVAFSADGNRIAATGSRGAVMTWTIDSEGVLSEAQRLTQHGQRVQCLALSPSSPFLITGSAKGDLIWQTYGSRTSLSRKQQALPRAAMAVHLPASGVRATATDGSTLARVDLKTSELIETQAFRRGVAHAAAFSSDGNKLALCTGYEIEIWDAATTEQLITLKAEREIQWSVTFLPDGQRLVSGSRGKVTLWDLERGEVISHFDVEGSYYVKTIAVSPHGKLLAAIPASAGQTLTIMRLPD